MGGRERWKGKGRMMGGREGGRDRKREKEKEGG